MKGEKGLGEKVEKKKVSDRYGDGGLWFWDRYYRKKRYEAWVKITPRKLVGLYKKGLSFSKIGEMYGVPKSEVARIYGLIEIPKRLRRRPTFRKELPDQWCMENPAVGYVLGALYGDGTVATGDAFKLSVIDRDFRSAARVALIACGFKKKEIKYFETEACGNRKRQYGLVLYNKALAGFVGGKPDYMYKLSDKAKTEFVNGFIDSEGSVTKLGSVLIFNTDKSLIDFVNMVLGENGIETSISIRQRRVEAWKDCYVIYIRTCSIERFHKLFRFSIQRKQKRLDEVVRMRKCRNKAVRFEDSDSNKKESGRMEIITKKFIKCPSCGHLIGMDGRMAQRKPMDAKTKEKIAQSVKKTWVEKRKAREQAGS